MQKMTQWITVATVATFALFISDAAFAAAPGEAQGYIGIGAGLAIGFAVLSAARLVKASLLARYLRASLVTHKRLAR